MAKRPDHSKTRPSKRKQRGGIDIVLPVRRGLSFFSAGPDEAKAYYTTEAYADGGQSGQWCGKGAAFLGLMDDGVRKTVEQIEADIRRLWRRSAKRRGRAAAKALWVKVIHSDSPLPLKPPNTTLWVNGVKITRRLWNRLRTMSDGEYKAFWDEQLKNMRWPVSKPGAKKE